MEESNQTEQEIWDKLFRPEILESFSDPYPDWGAVSISLFTTPTGPSTEAISIDPFFPFSTIDDLKIAIYHKKQKDPAFAPEYQFLAIPFGEKPESGQRAKRYVAVDFYFKKGAAPMPLEEPFSAATAERWDDRFVDSEGNRRILEGASRGRSCFEDVLLKPTQGNVPPLHLFLLRDIYATTRVPKPLSQPEYAGRIQSYFPSTGPETDGTKLSEKQNDSLKALYAYYLNKQTILEERLVPILQDAVFSNFPKIKDVKYLRFVWLQKKTKKALDTLFYEIPVSHSRPFLRFYPADNVAISKIQVKGVLPIPDIADPCLLLQWAKEKSPTGERDFLMGKIAIEQLFEGTPPVYATLQAVDDGTAALVIEPPKPLKRLDPLTNLKLLKESVARGLKGFPFADSRADIDEANMVASLRLPQGQSKLSIKDIHRRFAIFRGFFQEIPALEGESPIMALRYKAVSNFFREDRVSTYLTELASRHILNPSRAFEDMVNIISEEFSLTREEAVREFNKWKETKETIVPVEPQYDLYKLKYNPGIDILIYAQHPDYFFHLYRVDSYLNLRRILTLLTMMFTLPKDQLGIEEKQAAAVAVAAEESLPKVGEAAADGIVGAEALAVPGKPTDDAVAAELSEDSGDVGDAGELAEWDFMDNQQDDSPESAENTVSPVKAESLAKAAQGLPAAFKPAMGPAATAAPAAVAAQQPSSKLGVPTANYFIRKLQEADSRLFEYTKGYKSLKKYVSACAANERRQPAVLDQAGYDRMMLEYRPDMERDEVDIITYGYEKAEVSIRKTPLPYKTKQEVEEHTYVVLKYGTDITNQKYYLCSEFFCLRDEILVRKDEFYGTKFRANADPEFVGKRKEPERCPFCNGRLIKNFPEVKEGETVFTREVNISNKVKKHTHIGFYSKRLHPDGFGLPCCFTKEQVISSGDPFFQPLQDMSRRLRKSIEDEAPPDEEADEDEDEAEQVAEPVSGIRTPNYQDILQRVYRKYIVGPEKMPLEIGDEPQIGLLPPVLNEYFKQNIVDLVQRAQIRQELKSDAKGFLRIGVDNRAGHRAESFFAAIAPFLGRNSADQVRDLLKSKITARVFVNANYGNLLMEFFDPTFPVKAMPKEVKDFASKQLKITQSQQMPYFSRIYRSYIHFKGEEKGPNPSFLDDRSALKEYRQFAPLLAQDNIITPRGILFIVLDVQPDGSLQVVCPPYGYNETMRNADIAFLLHQGDIWEPIFYSKNTLPTATKPAQHLTTLRFQKATEPSWPPIVQKRVEEFRQMCKGPAVGQYTGIQMLAQGAKLVNLTLAVRMFAAPYLVYGIVRDTYNHLVACLFKADPEGEEDTGLIAFPVTDDGIVRPELQIYLNWDGFTPAPANLITDFYRKQLENLSAYPKIAAGYKPTYWIEPKFKEDPKKGKQVYAIQLANKVLIPASPPQEGSGFNLPPPPGPPPEILEWTINKHIMFSEGREYKFDQMKKIESEKQLDEIYEHFRLTFSNWLSSPSAGSQMRDDIRAILFPPTVSLGIDLPVYEKRKRLQILLSPLLSRWMDSSEPGPKPFEELLRVDCNGIAVAEKCKGPCVWKVRSGNTEGKCYIHTPKMEEPTTMNTPEIFLARLIEELIRFPVRRQQLLQEDKKYVSHLVSLKSAVRMGDTYVVPEDTAAWTDLLRLECAKAIKERTHFFEEISVEPESTEEIAETEILEKARIGALPDALKAILGGADPKTEKLAIYEWDREEVPEGADLAAVLEVLRLPLDKFPLPSGKKAFTGLEISRMTNLLKKGIVQVDLDATDPTPSVYGSTVVNDPEVYVLVKQEKTTRFLMVAAKGLGPIKEGDLPDTFAARIKALPKRAF